MAMPTLYIKSALRLAENGLGDGTVYASATGATPDAAQRTFALAGLSIIVDLGADADDKFNGHILYFPASGNKYHIVDWVASTDTATTWETPQIADTGACEIRRALVDLNALAANPALRLADGQKYAKWQAAAQPTIEVHLPNLIDNGGFESGLTGWTETNNGGTTDASGLNSTTPLIGVNDYKLNLGDRTNVILQRSLNSGYKSGRTYRLLFKARMDGVFVAGQFSANFVDMAAHMTLTNPSSGSVDQSADNANFKPTLSASAEWHSVELVIGDADIGPGLLRFILSSASFDVFFDEAYIYEIVNVSALLLFDSGGSSSQVYPNVSVTGRNVTKDRSGQTAGVDNVILLPDQITNELALKEFSAGSYPIYNIGTSASYLNSASEILLCEKWTWTRDVEIPVEYKKKRYDEISRQSRSGIKHFTRFNKERIIESVYRYMPTADKAILLDDWLPHHLDGNDGRHPFAILLSDETVPWLVRYVGDEFFIKIDGTVFASWAFRFEEVL